jgi:transcriptional regulator with XRE-family HTH domain
MNPKEEIRDFLTTRRARLSPEKSGLPIYGANRRITGLGREEVALLAGISVEYYTRLERGNVGSVSDGVLEGVAHALQLARAPQAAVLHVLFSLGQMVSGHGATITLRASRAAMAR